jgi:succinate dehydrogenase / fumarate reductase cytochrome b subunit
MICNFYASTIGKKIVVAVTGLILFGFVVAHLLGNLQIFLGPDKINEYAELLEKNEHILWVARAVLLAAVFLHAFATVQLSRLNRRSRPISYEHHETIQASLPSRVMIWGGLFLAFYIVFHLTHLTWGQTHPSFIEGDVYHNLISGFSVWYV